MSDAVTGAMNPYYDEGGITIYHGDCREVLTWGCASKADLVVTDPPYGKGEQYGVYEDTAAGLEELIATTWPLLCGYARIALTPGVANIHRWPAPAWTLCWLTPGGIGSGPWGFCTWQPVLVYGADPYLAAGLGRRPDSFTFGRRRGSIQSSHPCSKPPEVMNWIVSRVSVATTDTVLDPFMGSGSTLVAAKDSGRKAIGIEIEERYCEIAAKRLAQGVFDFATGGGGDG